MKPGDIILGLLVVALCLALTGCAKEVKTVAIDSYCATAEYRKLDPNDTPETFRENEAHNAYVDRRCPKRS